MKLSALINIDKMLIEISQSLCYEVLPDDSSDAQVDLAMQIFQQRILDAIKQKEWQLNASDITALFEDMAKHIGLVAKRNIQKNPSDATYVGNIFQELSVNIRHWANKTEINEPQSSVSLKL